MVPAQSAGYLSSGVTRLQPNAGAGLDVTGISPVTGTQTGFDYAEGTRLHFDASRPGSARLGYAVRPSTLLRAAVCFRFACHGDVKRTGGSNSLRASHRGLSGERASLVAQKETLKIAIRFRSCSRSSSRTRAICTPACADWRRLRRY